VIAAGSLLEVRMRDEGWSFPVGRVEFAYLYPATFEEFLGAIGENILLEAMRGLRVDKPLPVPLHDKLGNLLSLYMTIGGMPEAVSRYMETKSLTEVREIHEALFAAFSEDFGKYSRRSEVEYLRLVWEKIPFQLGQRIAYSRLSEQQARSRDISNAFSILHEAMLVERIWPTTRTKMPLVRKPKSAPKALYVDIGLCSHVAGVTLEQLSKRLADPLYDGGLAESFVGQEFMAANDSCRITPFFWIREEKNTSSELDYLLQMGDRLVPVEVKLRSHGALKSLHQYLTRSKTNLGVRVYGGELKYEKHRVALPDGTGLNYRLLSVPFYAAGRLKDFLEDLWDEEP